MHQFLVRRRPNRVGRTLRPAMLSSRIHKCFADLTRMLANSPVRCVTGPGTPGDALLDEAHGGRRHPLVSRTSAHLNGPSSAITTDGQRLLGRHGAPWSPYAKELVRCN